MAYGADVARAGVEAGEARIDCFDAIGVREVNPRSALTLDVTGTPSPEPSSHHVDGVVVVEDFVGS